MDFLWAKLDIAVLGKEITDEVLENIPVKEYITEKIVKVDSKVAGRYYNFNL